MSAWAVAVPWQTIQPSVALPKETAAKFADAAAPEPELEPHGFRLMPYWLLVCPPRPDHPLIDSNERKLAHSERLVLPRITAPPSRRVAATVESRGAGVPKSAKEPAVGCTRAPVSLLGLGSTGVPAGAPSGV